MRSEIALTPNGTLFHKKDEALKVISLRMKNACGMARRLMQDIHDTDETLRRESGSSNGVTKHLTRN